MLAPQSTLGSHSSCNSGATTSNASTRMGGKLRELADKVSYHHAEKAPLELTFGIEAEFMLLGAWPADDYRNVESPIPVIVYEALAELVSAECAECGKPHYFYLPLVRPTNYQTYDTSLWDIGSDSSVQLHGEERQMYQGDAFSIEIRSRVFTKGYDLPTTDSKTDPLHRHSISVEQEITLVFERLHHAFNTPDGARGVRAGMRLVVPPTAGYHVHVGNGVMSRGFSLQTVKNLFSIYVANERSIDSIQNAERIGGSRHAITPLTEQLSSWSGAHIAGPVPYNWPHSQFFIQRAFGLLCDKARGRPHHLSNRYPVRELHVPQIARSAYSFEPADWLNLIQNAESISDLRDTHRQFEHTNTLNLQNLDNEFGVVPASSRRNGGKVTVEFRQHAGTIEAREILPWIDLTVSMVQTAHVSSPATMREHLDRVLTDPNYDIFKLMSFLGCQSSTDDHYRHQLGITNLGRNYAGDCRAEQMRNANEIEDEASEVRRHLIGTRAAALSPTSVQDRINMKFKMGGYGRFKRAYLDACKVELSEAEKERLTAGTIITHYATSESGESEDENFDTSDLALSPVAQESRNLPQQLGTFSPIPLKPNHPFFHAPTPFLQAPALPRSPTDARNGYNVTDSESVASSPRAMQTPRGPALAPVAPGALDLPEFGLALPPPSRPFPGTTPRPTLVMDRRGQQPPALDTTATDSIIQRIREHRRALGVTD